VAGAFRFMGKLTTACRRLAVSAASAFNGASFEINALFAPLATLFLQLLEKKGYPPWFQNLVRIYEWLPYGSLFLFFGKIFFGFAEIYE
jgi:hypothetical protein